LRIITRYLAKEITAAMLAVTVILLFIFMCNKLVRYLGFIAKGKYAAWVLVHIVLLQVPVLLGLLLPIGLYLGILLAYGRLYAESEMTVLAACGFSHKALVRVTLGFALVVMLIVAGFTLWIQPMMVLQSERVLADAKSGSLIQTMMPGRFREMSSGSKQRVVYVGKLSRNHKQMSNVFMAQRDMHPKKTQKNAWEVMFADAGHEQFDIKTGNDYLVTTGGQIYKGVPGQRSFQILHYKDYGVRANNKSLSGINTDPETMSLARLWLASQLSNRAKAELQWRFSIPLAVIILALIALPLSKLKPRQGRFARILPAAIIYIIYANLLFAARGWVSNGAAPSWMGMWWVNIIALLFAIGLNIWPKISFFGRAKNQ
jgi:lipopolysaccharide export system permease protein